MAPNALFSDRPGKRSLKLLDQFWVTRKPVRFGNLIGLLRQDTAGDAVQLPANSGELNQNIGAVSAGGYHVLYQLHMPDGSGNAIGYIVGIIFGLKSVVSHSFTILYETLLYIVSLRKSARNPGGGIQLFCERIPQAGFF